MRFAVSKNKGLSPEEMESIREEIRKKVLSMSHSDESRKSFQKPLITKDSAENVKFPQVSDIQLQSNDSEGLIPTDVSLIQNKDDHILLSENNPVEEKTVTESNDRNLDHTDNLIGNESLADNQDISIDSISFSSEVEVNVGDDVLSNPVKGLSPENDQFHTSEDNKISQSYKIEGNRTIEESFSYFVIDEDAVAKEESTDSVSTQSVVIDKIEESESNQLSESQSLDSKNEFNTSNSNMHFDSTLQVNVDEVNIADNREETDMTDSQFIQQISNEPNKELEEAMNTNVQNEILKVEKESTEESRKLHPIESSDTGSEKVTSLPFATQEHTTRPNHLHSTSRGESNLQHRATVDARRYTDLQNMYNDLLKQHQSLMYRFQELENENYELADEVMALKNELNEMVKQSKVQGSKLVEAQAEIMKVFEQSRQEMLEILHKVSR